MSTQNKRVPLIPSGPLVAHSGTEKVVAHAAAGSKTMTRDTVRLTAHEWTIVLHALRTAAELHEETAAKFAQHGAEKLANDFKRRADAMRRLTDRIEQREEPK